MARLSFLHLLSQIESYLGPGQDFRFDLTGSLVEQM